MENRDTDSNAETCPMGEHLRKGYLLKDFRENDAGGRFRGVKIGGPGNVPPIRSTMTPQAAEVIEAFRVLHERCG